MSHMGESCPRCGTTLEADEVDVGVGVVYGPVGCPGCFWMPVEGAVTDEGTGRRMTVVGRTCAECRYVATDKQPKPIEATGFGDQMMFADEDETVYTCKAPQENPNAGRFFGPTPVTCDGWAMIGVANSGADRLNELDRLIAQRESRGKGRGE